MTKYQLMDDYSEGCHPAILDALSQSNTEQQTAYGDDIYCEKAREFIAAECGRSELPVYFVSGGTLANIIITASALRPHEAIVSASSGHIATHETGAIEAVGHKIIGIETNDGKLTPDTIAKAVNENSFAPHMAKPRMVYLSNATELGTVYSRSELKSISTLCKELNLLLMVDGARLGVALASSKTDLTLPDIASLTDIFWIGGTKAGALIGEAIVIPNAKLAEDFAFHIKQRGALLAKGRLLGLQFLTLFRDNLFSEGSHRANSLASKLSEAITHTGFELLSSTDCNQVFPVLPNALIKTLEKEFSFHTWKAMENDQTAVRLVTSWATEENQIEKFIKVLDDWRKLS